MSDIGRVAAILARGLLAGLAAGLLAFAVLKLGAGPAGGGGADAAPVASGDAGASALWGLAGWPMSWSTLAGLAVEFGTGYGLGGLLLGAVFALVFAAVDGRLGATGPRATAALLAASAWVVLDLVPGLLSPAWPPGLVDAHQAELGMELRIALTMFSLAGAVVALAVRAQLPPTMHEGAAAALALMTYGLAIALLGLTLWGPVPAGAADLPAAVLWRFRAATLGAHAVLWLGLGLGFGRMVERSLRPRAQALARRALA